VLAQLFCPLSLTGVPLAHTQAMALMVHIALVGFHSHLSLAMHVVPVCPVQLHLGSHLPAISSCPKKQEEHWFKLSTQPFCEALPLMQAQLLVQNDFSGDKVKPTLQVSPVESKKRGKDKRKKKKEYNREKKEKEKKRKV
jgi:hypothetical protein